jgi:cyclase
MLQKRIIPCLLLKEGLLVKTIQFNNPKHIGEPIYAIKIFNDYEVDELMIVDIMASRNPNLPRSKIPFDLISKISDESCMPITYGGGIHSVGDMRALFNAGIEKVCINTAAVKNPALVREASREFGSQSIVVALDVRKDSPGNYGIFTQGGTVPVHLDPVACAARMEEQGAGEILLNSIDRDGTMQGYDIDLIKAVASAVNIPLIALGGAGTPDDLSRALHEGHASAAAAGSMFVYFGRKKAVLINYLDTGELRNCLKN